MTYRLPRALVSPVAAEPGPMLCWPSTTTERRDRPPRIASGSLVAIAVGLFAGLASCGVRAPAAIDVDAMIRVRGPVEARRDLVVRVTGDPRDVAAHLALAALDDRSGRPSEAIDELEAVVALGGPLGPRWTDADRARLARLIATRGRARLARGAATAVDDFARARALGAAIDDGELRRARLAAALAALRHSDAEVRAVGRRALAELAASASGGTVPSAAAAPSGAVASAAPGEPERAAWAGARPGASPEQRGQFGAWLWQQGARRAAWDELAAWHAAMPPPRDGALEQAYLVAARWWTPLDRPSPLDGAPDPASTGDPTGALRCAFVACPPRDVVGDDAAEHAYLEAPLAPPVRDPTDAAAVVIIALHQALRGEASWGAAIAARVDLAAFAAPDLLAALPAYARPVIARLVGRDAPIPSRADAADARLVIAAARALAGAGAAEVTSGLDSGRYGDALRAMIAPRAPFDGDARAEAVARHAGQVVAGAASHDALRAIAAGFARDPAIADRLGRDAVATASDAAAMQAVLGAVFDALGDPARARAAWQAAVDASREPRFQRGLAEAQARGGDGDVALITATAAAAASGDPAVVWGAVSRALTDAGRYVHALDAAHSAIDLAGPDCLTAALDAAIAASRALGRDAQAAALAAQRARVAPAGGSLGDRDPTDAQAALDAHRAHAGSATIAQLWVASRWNPRDVALRAALRDATPPGDPRRNAVAAELVDLAGDPDPDVSRAAAAALR